MHKIQIFLPIQEMPLLYLSESKTVALEDCILFFPGLFKLTKSIVVSEPVSASPITGGGNPGQDVTTDI